MSGERITVLAVDDEEEILEIINRYLSEDDLFTVIGARSVGEALEIMTNHDISAIVSDYQMPGANGIEFLSCIREQGINIPFILFTGRGCEEVVIQALNLGASFYMVKGEDPSLQFHMLKMQILSHISKKKAEDALVESERKNRRMLAELRATLQATEEGILVTDRDGYITNYNDQFLQLWGLTHEQIQGSHIERFLEHFSNLISDPQIIAEIAKTKDEPRSLRRHLLHRSDGKVLEIFFRPQQCDKRIIGTVYSFRDITAQVRSDMMLQESRERFRVLFDHSPVGHMVINPDGTISEVNKACLSLMKRSRESLIGQPFHEIVADTSKKQYFACLEKVVQSDEKHSIELELVDGEGALVTVLADGCVIKDHLGQVVHIQCILRDITYQRNTEKKLHWTESLLNEIVNLLPFGICVTSADHLEISYHNKFFLDVWGLDVITKIPRTQTNLTLHDFFAAAEVMEDYTSHVWIFDSSKDPDVRCWDIELSRKRVIRVYSCQFTEKDGNVRILWAFEDITRFRNQEEEIRKYARKIEILSRIILLSGKASSASLLCDLSLSALISLLHFEGGAFYLLSEDKKTSVMASHVGLSEEFIREFSVIDPNEYPFLYKEEKPLFTNNLSYIMPDFSEKWGIGGSAFIPVLSGNRILGSIHLISKKPALVSIEEKEILLGIGREIGNGLARLFDQNQLVQERKNLENLVQSIGDMVLVIEANTYQILAINEEVLRKTGLYKEDLIGRPIKKSNSPYINSLPLEKVFHDSQSIKYPVMHVDGSRVIMEARITKGLWNGKEAYFCLCRDISSEIFTQEEIRQSEERLNAIFVTCPIGIILFDPDDVVIQINPAALSMFGIRVPLDLIRYSYKDDPNFPDVLKKKIENREEFSAEITYDLSRSGICHEDCARLEPKQFHIMVTPVSFSAPLTRDGYYMLIEDITARHQIESELRRVKQRLELIMEASDDGFFVYHVKDQTLFLSQRLRQMIGLSLDREQYLLSEILQLVHEDDRAVLFTSFHAIAQGTQEVMAHELRIYHPKEGLIWIYVRGKITGYDTENNKGRFAGAVTDITKRKVSEQKLLESENFNRNLVASLPDYLLVYDAQGTILYVNDSAVRAMRSVPAEIIGRNFLDFIVPEMRPFVLHQSQKRSRGEVVDPYEVRIMRRDGSFIDAVIHVAPILYQGRQAVLAVVTDITERRHSEENLARYAETLKDTVDALALANRKLNLLSHMTRHDILNQVHIVLSYLSLLEEYLFDPEQEQILEKISRAVGFIQRHIEFTRQYQDLGIHSPRWQNMGDIMSMLDFNGIRVEVQRDTLEIFADPLLPKVFENLLDNVLRHGKHVTKLSIHYEIQPDNQLMLVWEDDGIGIADEAKTRIFEWGYGKNTGLGLFLIKEILSLSNITIYEAGISGKGARFCLLIPEGKYRFGSCVMINTWYEL